MKQIALIPLFLLLAMACTTQTAADSRLLEVADSLLHVRPDSALRILESCPAALFRTEAERAYHALLLIQARNKNYILQTDDSLIRTVAHYYDAQNDVGRRARAYYLWGGVHRDREEDVLAIQKFLAAVPLARQADDSSLLGRIYIGIGSLYYSQALYGKADSIYRLTASLGIQLQDTSLWAESLCMQGHILFYQHRYPEAEERLMESLKVLGDFRQDGIRSDITSMLSLLCAKSDRKEEAILYAKQNLALQKDTARSYWEFLLLADAYYRAEKYDSALIYLNKSMASPSLGVQTSTYMRLADVARAQGDVALSLEMERMYSACKDSLERSRQDNEMIEAEQQMLMKQQQSKYESFLRRERCFAGGMFAICVALFCLFYRRYRKKALAGGQAVQQSNDEHDEVARELEKRSENLNKLRMEWARKSLEHLDVYAKMQRIISECRDNDFSKEELSEEEWLKLLVEVDRGGSHLASWKLSSLFRQGNSSLLPLFAGAVCHR